MYISLILWYHENFAGDMTVKSCMSSGGVNLFLCFFESRIALIVCHPSFCYVSRFLTFVVSYKVRYRFSLLLYAICSLKESLMPLTVTSVVFIQCICFVCVFLNYDVLLCLL